MEILLDINNRIQSGEYKRLEFNKNYGKIDNNKLFILLKIDNNKLFILLKIKIYYE